MFLGSVFSWWELTNSCHRLSCAAVCQEKIWPWESQCTELPTALGLCASSAQQRAIYRVMRSHCIEPATLTCSNGTQRLHLDLFSEKVKKKKNNNVSFATIISFLIPNELLQCFLVGGGGMGGDLQVFCSPNSVTSEKDVFTAKIQ